MKRIVILGGGIAGLNCLARLSRDNEVTVLEKENEPGGLLRTFRSGGFLFDRTGHLLHSMNPSLSSFTEHYGIELKKTVRNAAVYIENKYIPYPVQLNIRHLSPRLRNEVIDQILKSQPEPFSENTDFDTWVKKRFGDGLYENFFKPYNEKLYRMPLSRIKASYFSKYLPAPDKLEMIASLKTGGAGAGYNAEFRYPAAGGIQAIIDNFAKAYGENIRTGIKVSAVDISKKILHADGEKIGFDALITTIPFPEFLLLSGSQMDLKPAYVNVHDLNLGLNAAEFPFHWAYYPSPEIPFYRIGSFSNISASLCPPGKQSLYVETSFSDSPPQSSVVIEALESLGILKASDIIVRDERMIPYAYPVYDSSYGRIKEFQNSMKNSGVFFFGRSSAWEYLSISEIFHNARNFCKEVSESIND